MVLHSDSLKTRSAKGFFGDMDENKNSPILRSLRSFPYTIITPTVPPVLSSLQDPSGSQARTGSCSTFFVLLVLYLCFSKGWEIPDPESSMSREKPGQKEDE